MTLTRWLKYCAWLPVRRRSLWGWCSSRLLLEELEPRTVPSATVYRSADVPQPIPDLGTATSTLTVPDSETIGTVSVTLNVTHPRGGDLDVFLLAPNGTRLKLLTDVAFGQAGSAAPFLGLTLEAQADLSVREAGARAARSYLPEESLKQLTGANAQGTWTLEVSDDTAGLTGSIVDWSLTITEGVTEVEPNSSPTLPQIIDPTVVVVGSIASQTDVDEYQLTLSRDGVLRVRVEVLAGLGFHPRLVLLGPDRQELVRSEGDAAGGIAAVIEQSLPAGTYVLDVSAQTITGLMANGEYELSTSLAPASLARERQLVGDEPSSVALGDVNGDGRPDLVTANEFSNDVSVLLGNGDGSFQPQRRFAVGVRPAAVAVGDFNGDGRLDLVTANDGAFLFPENSVSVLLGNGDGSFQAQLRFAVGVRPRSLAMADVNGDGRPDLITANVYSDDVSVLLAVPVEEDAAFFQPQRRFSVGDYPSGLALADVNGDGQPDLVTANEFSNDVSVLLGNGDGSFQTERRVSADDSPTAVALGDVNGDGRTDLVTANFFSPDLRVRLGNGDGSFQNIPLFTVGAFPGTMVLGDANADGLKDLLIANVNGDEVSVRLGVGDGTFLNELRFAVGDVPVAVVLGDVTGDGRPDLVTANRDSDDVSVLLGNGDGSFQKERRFAVGTLPYAVVLGDVNDDGRTDLVVANSLGNDVSVLLSNGDGSFQTERRFAVGFGPQEVALGDVNGDGRADLVTTSFLDGGLSLLFGNGDGSFQPQRRRGQGGGTLAVLLGDVNGDSRPDLVTANGSDNVRVLLGNGDGTFPTERRFAVGDFPYALAWGDVNSDGHPDLVTANRDSDDVSVLLGFGDGSFQNERRVGVGLGPRTVALGDVNGDGHLDLVTANSESDDVSVLLGTGTGSFQTQRRFPVGSRPLAIAVRDINGDGRTDLLIANEFSYDVSMLLGDGDGSFQTQRRLAVGNRLSDVSVGDVNGDGRDDLVTANRSSGSVSVLLGNGTGQFVLRSAETTVALRHTPQRADLDGDGAADIVQLNAAGQLLFRRGLPGGANLYAPPLIVNPTRPARDLVLVQSVFGPRVAVSEVRTNSVALYAFSQSFEFQGLRRVADFDTDRLPQRLAVGDLDGDGRDDLVVGNTLSGTVTVAVQQPEGSFVARLSLDVGITPSEIALADLDGQGGLDLLVTDQFSSQLVVADRYNDTLGAFAGLARFRAGVGFSDTQLLNGSPQVHTLEQPVSVVAADFNRDDAVDAVVVNRGASSFNTLLGTPGGGFANPTERLRFSTSRDLRLNDQAGQARAFDFNGDGSDDVAILMENRNEIWLYQGQGDGAFTLLTTVPVGNAPTGFSLAQLNDDNNTDLLVGNGFGDVLSILGNGDGTFRPFVRADNRVPFVATDLNNDGAIDVVLAQQATDRAVSRVRAGNAFSPGAFERDGRTGLIGPGDVALANIDGRNGKDLLFANTGSNNVLVYLRRGNGTFADQPLSFFAGTNPTGLHVAQLNDDNGDGVIDNRDFVDLAIANQGSNDVSVLLGSRRRDSNRDGEVNGQDLFRLGPRLGVGEAGPTLVNSGLINGDRIPDLVSASRLGGTATLLPGRNNGLFNDVNPTTVPLPDAPVGLDGQFVLLAGGDIVSLGFGAGVARLLASTGRDSVAFDAVDVGLDLPLFFVANTDGSVTALVPNDGQFLAITQVVDGLDSPSALRILRDSSGFDAYISDARDGGLTVIRFGIDELQLNLEPVGGGSGLALAATLTTSLAGTNSLLVTNVPLLTDVLLDPNVVLGVEDVLTEPTFVNGVVVGPGELLLAALEEQLDALDNQPPATPVVTPDTLEQYLFGLDEAMRQLGWKQVPGRPVPLMVEPLWDWWHWLERGRDAIDWLMSNVPPCDDPAPPPEETSALPTPEREFAATPADCTPAGWSLAVLALAGAGYWSHYPGRKVRHPSPSLSEGVGEDPVLRRSR